MFVIFRVSMKYLFHLIFNFEINFSWIITIGTDTSPEIVDNKTWQHII